MVSFELDILYVCMYRWRLLEKFIGAVNTVEKYVVSSSYWKFDSSLGHDQPMEARQARRDPRRRLDLITLANQERDVLTT